MPDVTLTLKADNSQYVSKIKEAQSVSQSLYDSVERSQKRELGLIEDIEQALDQLQKAKKKAYTVEDIEKYNQKIAEAKVHLKEYETAGTESMESVKKSSNSLIAVLGGLTAAIASVGLAFRTLKDQIKDSEVGLNNWNITAAVTKQLIYDIVHRTPWKEWGQNMKDVIDLQDKLNELRKIERQSLKEAEQFQIVYKRNLVEAKDQTKSATERLQYYDYALKALNKSIDIENKNTATRLALVKEWLKTAPDTESLLQEESDLTLKLLNIEERRWSSQQEINSMRTGIMKQMSEEQKKVYEEQLKAEYEMTKETYLAYRDSFFDFVDEVNKKAEESWDFNQDLAESAFKRIKAEGEKMWDEILKKEKAQEELDKYSTERMQENMNTFSRSIVSYIGSVDEIMQKEVEKTQFLREQLDTRISETQSAIEIELQLYKNGYSANIREKQIELDTLKAQRDKSLADEEQARKRQHRLQVATIIAEKASAIAEIVINTRIANAKALKLSPLTFGQPWVAYNNISSAVSIGAIIAAIAAASASKFAKGGWTGKGGMRDETGERVAGIVHEEEFVVKRGPAHRFRDVLDAINKEDRSRMIKSFNKLIPDIVGGTTNVNIENSGPNNRLDRINNQLHQLNNSMKPSKKKEEVILLQDSIVYRNGNSTRTIRK